MINVHLDISAQLGAHLLYRAHVELIVPLLVWALKYNVVTVPKGINAPKLVLSEPSYYVLLATTVQVGWPILRISTI